MRSDYAGDGRLTVVTSARGAARCEHRERSDNLDSRARRCSSAAARALRATHAATPSAVGGTLMRSIEPVQQVVGAVELRARPPARRRGRARRRLRRGLHRARAAPARRAARRRVALRRAAAGAARREPRRSSAGGWRCRAAPSRPFRVFVNGVPQKEGARLRGRGPRAASSTARSRRSGSASGAGPRSSSPCSAPTGKNDSVDVQYQLHGRTTRGHRAWRFDPAGQVADLPGSLPRHANRRDPGRAAARLLLRVLPAQDRRGLRQPARDPRRPAPRRPRLRLGDLRRAGLHARPHDRHRQVDQAGARDRGDGALHLRGRHHARSCAPPSPRSRPPASRTCWRCAATRPRARPCGSPDRGRPALLHRADRAAGASDFDFAVGAAAFPEVHPRPRARSTTSAS